jgi:hypothetical protein
MPNLKDISLNPEDLKLKVLGWGQPGSGKTYFYREFPAPRYLFDFDGGYITLRGCDIEFDLYQDAWDQIQGGKLVNSAWDIFEKKLQEFAKDLPFASVCLDSITALELSIMEKLQKLNPSMENGRKKRAPTLPDYQELIAVMKRLLIMFKNLPCNVYVTAHEQILQNELTKSINFLPRITGKNAPSELFSWFDEVYHFEPTEEKGVMSYKVRTTPAKKHFAKSRWGCLDTYEEASFERILEKVRASV